MENNSKIGRIILFVVILLIIWGVFLLMGQSHSKNIEMSGYQLEVPDNDASVIYNCDNYNTYYDSKNDITIKSWAWKNSNSTDLNGCVEIGSFLVSHTGENTTYNNVTLYNQSGYYTFYELDQSKAAMILIAGSNIDEITNIVNTMNRTAISPTDDIDSILALTINAVNGNSEIQNNQSTTTQSKSSSSSKSSEPGVVNEYMQENYQAGDGSSYRQVEYSDGNIRQYNSKGQLIGSSFESDQGYLKQQAGSNWPGD